jgi:hypothetical protein
MGKYFVLLANEDIFLTKNGKVIGQIINPKRAKSDILHSLIGVVPNNGYTLEQAKSERLSRHESVD